MARVRCVALEVGSLYASVTGTSLWFARKGG